MSAGGRASFKKSKSQTHYLLRCPKKSFLMQMEIHSPKFKNEWKDAYIWLDLLFGQGLSLLSILKVAFQKIHPTSITLKCT